MTTTMRCPGSDAIIVSFPGFQDWREGSHCQPSSPRTQSEMLSQALLEHSTLVSTWGSGCVFGDFLVRSLASNQKNT